MSAEIGDGKTKRMFKHTCTLIVCTLVSVVACGVIGEAIWPSGAFIGASIWLASVAGVVAPIVYVVAVLVRRDARMRRKEPGAENRSAIRPIALTTCIVTIAITFGLGVALRLGWIGR